MADTPSSPTTQLGNSKIIIALVTLVSGLCVGFFGHDWSTAAVILGGGGAFAGILSGFGLRKAADAS